MRFEVLKEVKMFKLVFWVVMPYGLDTTQNTITDGRKHDFARYLNSVWTT
jgi:hypothetical protein